MLELKDEIRGTCALPYSIPDKEINRIIDQAKKYFYRNYKESVESQHYVVPMEEFKKQAQSDSVDNPDNPDDTDPPVSDNDIPDTKASDITDDTLKNILDE